MYFARILAGTNEDEFPANDHCGVDPNNSDDNQRRLAGGGDAVLDYTVFNVAIMTLALLLLFEYARHYVDVKASRHRFVKRVLEVLYEELSTLGMVESIIFILVKYNESNKRFIEVELVFAQVHFMLFYTTIFNAMMSCLVAYGSKRISKNLWVKSESMDMDHYVTIRHGFNNLEEKLNSDIQEDMVEGFIKFDMKHWKSVYKNVMQFLRSPQMARKRNAMLVVIRFHEIRAHFLKVNKLPAKFKVSDYLKNCEREVFSKLVHIPASLWLILIGVLNLIYYAMGLVASAGNTYEQDENNARIGRVLSRLFIGTCIFFAFMSIAMFQRIKWIFSQIIQKNFLDHENDTIHGFGKHDTQIELFPFGNPNLFITILRYLQFGFALASGTLLVFWDNISITQNHHIIQLRWALFGCLIVTYWIFFQNVKHLIPRFTLCTNLGQLVNNKQLHETLYAFHLEQEMWNRKISRGYSGRQKFLHDDHNDDVNVKNELATKKEGNDMQSKLTALEQISEFARLPTESLPSAKGPDKSKRRPRRDRRRSLSDSAAFFAPFPASTQTFRNTIEDKSQVQKDLRKGKVKSKTTEDMPTKPRRKRRERSASAPIRGGVSTLFAIDEKNKVDEDKKQSINRSSSNQGLATLFEYDVPPVPLEKKDADTLSVSTSITMYEGSDTEDIPVAQVVSNEADNKRSSSLSLEERIHLIYGTKLYNTMDTVVGTFFCMYLIGMRLEVLLVDSCKINASMNSIEFSKSTAFWLEFSLLVYFLFSSAIFVFAHVPKGISAHQFEIFVAELLDIILSGVCLTLLMVAEFNRCQTQGQCPPFGFRSGVGKIEPFTAIIAFRSLRHSMGTFTANRLRQLKTGGANPDVKFSLRESWFMRPDTTQNPIFFHKDHGNHHKEKDLNDALFESWTKTIERHPELVQKHGMFSSEILQSMLGLDILESRGSNDVGNNKEKSFRASRNQSIIHSKNHSQIETHDLSRKSKKWSRLSPIAQSVIFSGEVGQPIDFSGLHRSASWISNYDSDEDEESMVSSLVSFENGLEDRKKDRPCDRNFGVQQSKILSINELKAPHAVLIRSMRRCERKMLPFFDSWELVDVVVTEHEMLFFAVEVIDEREIREDETIEKQKLGVREAMIAQHGGKGFLLSDVAIGRKIVGHTDISHITSIKIHQPSAMASKVPDLDRNSDSAPLSEYWSQLENVCTHKDLNDRFTSVRAKQLKIEEECGQTIMLRFLCDLDLAERTNIQFESKRVEKNDLKSIMPLLWCHTMIRMIGPNNLEQKLPHFGDDNDDELNDYFEDYGREKHITGRMRTFATTFVSKRKLFEPSSKTEVRTDLI